MMHFTFYTVSAVVLICIALLGFISLKFLYLFFIAIPLIVLGIYDLTQKRHNVLRNYPITGHLRYIFEFVRPEIQQYFVATNQSGRPYNREVRSVVYQRSKNVIDTLPFGTQQDICSIGYEYVYHSMYPTHLSEEDSRIKIGNHQCLQPYSASRLNISGMSFGALSRQAVEALNRGAQMGNFAQNTGEGGLTPYHLKHGGDIIWQIGTAYFGCRTLDGKFSREEFKQKAILDNVKMIELKISQGAKPSHGGILPAAKITKEIAELRGIKRGKDCLSPPAHSEFNSPVGMLKFIAQLKELSGGKPVGFKICIGIKKEFIDICQAMLETNIYPDFIAIDGAEGGTGAAPLEFSNRLGTPINEAIVFVTNYLKQHDLRDKITIIASGKIATGFDMLTKVAIGADCCNVARAMMFSVGCIQALKCNTNECPTGVTTQNPLRAHALVPKHKSIHVRNYHDATINSFLELAGALGVKHLNDLNPSHINRRVDANTSKTYAEIYT